MTEELFREDSYLKECDAAVVAIDDGAPTPPAALTYLWQQVSGPAAFIDDRP